MFRWPGIVCSNAILRLLVILQVPDPGVLLPGLLPQLVARMGRLPVVEPAEEVRLVGLQLLEVLVGKAAAR